jgi:hypothetical protein
MKWRNVMMLGLLSCWLTGCWDFFTRPEGSLATPPGGTGERSSEDFPTPRLLELKLGIPSE